MVPSLDDPATLQQSRGMWHVARGSYPIPSPFCSVQPFGCSFHTTEAELGKKCFLPAIKKPQPTPHAFPDRSEN
ncbi:hypothetical protein VNO78_17883 [Psophocarpus tetragonolobus]|uniref:Uncharacterized protein n=1 Tax=Psophocarpus tetragonolobus TaxID=3891 RepID=A0AAN9SIC2_PSOTE